MLRTLVTAFLVKYFIIGNNAMVSESQKATIQVKLLTAGMQCLKDHHLSAEDIVAFRDKRMPDGENAKCFAACLFKKIGFIDEMGKINQAGAMHSAKQVFEENSDHMMKFNMFLDNCSSVNEQPVSDGSRGCDRAKLAFGCFVENAPKFGLNMDF